jgi:uncharacterized membrane protein YgcG
MLTIKHTCPDVKITIAKVIKMILIYSSYMRSTLALLGQFLTLTMHLYKSPSGRVSKCRPEPFLSSSLYLLSMSILMNELLPAARSVEYHEIAVIAAAGDPLLDNLLDIGLVEPILLMVGISSRFPARGEQLLGKLYTRPCAGGGNTGGGGGRNTGGGGGRNAGGNRTIAVWVHICLLGYQLLKSVAAGLKRENKQWFETEKTKMF